LSIFKPMTEEFRFSRKIRWMEMKTYTSNKSCTKRAYKMEVTPAAFPSYLNSGGVHHPSDSMALNCRRSSLLEGLEQTIALMQRDQSNRLVLPKHVTSEENKEVIKLSELSHLPVPILPLYRFQIPQTLRRFSYKPTRTNCLGRMPCLLKSS